MPQTYAPIRAGAGGILLEAPDTLPSVGVLALAVDAAGKMSSVAFPATTRETLGLATTDIPTFAGVNLGGTTSSFPTIKRNGTAINFRLADDTADAPITASNITASGTIEAADLKTIGVSSTSRIFQQGGVGVLSNQVANIAQWVSGEFNLYGRIGLRINTSPTYIDADAANTLAQRNSTNGQKSRLYKTYTSATSGEWLELDAATDASNFDIAASIGSAGGTARGIRIGGKNAAGTFTSALSIATNGDASFSGAVQLGNAAVAETPAATHTLIIKDSTGTSYRVLAVAV